MITQPKEFAWQSRYLLNNLSNRSLLSKVSVKGFTNHDVTIQFEGAMQDELFVNGFNSAVELFEMRTAGWAVVLDSSFDFRDHPQG